MISETAKLPKDQSYVLKPSALASALQAAGVTIDTHFVRAPSRIFIDANFWPPHNLPHDRLYVTSGTVPREQAERARLFVEHKALPDLAGWIADIMSRDPASPVRREAQLMRILFPVAY
ncbi:hypothetical protein QFZ27_001649 [Inquilinus ginsengisoli]|uniref:hypothetical protein n=1 Tax=Inquilinus ginsengisoli TaxID=363840 RepID=UPI003D22DD76